jgi:hypothetical protein
MNYNLARETLHAVLDHRDRWHQGSWGQGPRPDQDELLEFDTWGFEFHVKPIEMDHCGTTMCFAGWAASIAHPKSKLLLDGSGTAEYMMFADGTVHDIRETAAADLDLSYEQTSDLFAGDNELADLVRHLDHFGVDATDILLERQLTDSLRMQFDAQGGRGVELADEIDRRTNR